MLLQQNAMLCSLTISQWTAKKQDKKATAYVKSEFNTTDDAGRYNKALLASTYLDQVKKAANAARTYHYENTLPWLDSGARILPAKHFSTYSAKMREFRADFENAVDAFLHAYPNLVWAAADRLGHLYSSEDYPTAGRIARKFAFDVQVNPIPAADDFRADISAEEVTAIRADLESRAATAQALAGVDLWKRIHTAVSAMAERLSDPKAVFRDSLVSNLCELAEILPALNISDDPMLENLRERLVSTLCRTSPAELREFPQHRAETAAEAAAILDAMAPFMAETEETEEV